jgi:hypothetical protein
VFWYVAVIVEITVCGWVQLERRAMRRGGTPATAEAVPPLHRLYGRALGRIRSAVERRDRPKAVLERREARRRTGLVTFALITAAMAPIFLFVLVQGLRMSPVLGQLVAWSTLWLSPLLICAPARLLALLVAVWLGWLRLDDGDGGQLAAVPVPGSGPDSHDYLLPR